MELNRDSDLVNALLDNYEIIIMTIMIINSIRNKFILAERIVKAFDLFLISEPVSYIFGFKVLGETVTDLEVD